jgi:hypothetical protein
MHQMEEFAVSDLLCVPLSANAKSEYAWSRVNGRGRVAELLDREEQVQCQQQQ